MANYYFFRIGTDAATDFVLDNNAMSVQLPDMQRAYEKIDLFSDGAIIHGAGQMIANVMTFTKKFRASGSEATAFNPARNTVMNVMGIPKYMELWLHILDASGVERRTRVFPIGKSGESFASLRISSEVTFTFQLLNGYFEKTTATTETKTLTSTSYDTIDVTNNGMLEVPPICKLTPSVACTLFQVEIAYGYGFTLQGLFLAGKEIAFDCATGIATVDGQIVSGVQSAGSIFKLPPGDSTLGVYGQAGDLEIEFYERSI